MPHLILVADIGGTSSRLALVGPDSHPQDVRTLPGMKSAPKRLPEPFAAKDARSPRLTRCLLLAAAIALIALGVLNGGMHDLLVKAINICTECIGLG